MISRFLFDQMQNSSKEHVVWCDFYMKKNINDLHMRYES